MLNAEVWNNSTLVRDDLVNDERVAHHVFDDALVRRDTFGMRGCGRSIWATHRGTARDVVRVGRRQVYLTTRLDETHTPMAHYARTGCLDKREVVLYEVSYDYPTSPVDGKYVFGVFPPDPKYTVYLVYLEEGGENTCTPPWCICVFVYLLQGQIHCVFCVF